MASGLLSGLLGFLRNAQIFPSGSKIEWDLLNSITYGEALDERQLNALTPGNATAGGTFKYDPPFSTMLPAGEHVLTATFTPADLKTNKKAKVAVAKNKITVEKAMPVLRWKAPDALYLGAQLSKKQLNCACLNLPGGEYEYNPPLRSLCPEGENVLTVTYIPDDDLRKNYHNAVAKVTIRILALKQPTFYWSPPDEMVYGEPLGPLQLCAMLQEGFEDKGVVAYVPPLGTILDSTAAARLTVEFTPFNKVEYKSQTHSVTMSIRKAESTIAWPIPEPVYFGTALSKTQLCATCSNLAGGIFRYNITTRTVLPEGDHELSVEYTPERAFQKNFTNGSARVILRIMPLHQPVFSWPAPADIIYGTLLSPLQLCAALDQSWVEHGTVTYSPAEGTLFDCTEAVTLSVRFEPDNPLQVLPAEASVTLRVVRAEPVLAWASLQPILMHTLLSEVQRTATCSLPGNGAAFGEFIYAPAEGAHLEVGSHTLAATFVPSYAYRRNFNSATIINELRVDKPEPLIAWSDPPDVHVGRPITKKHLNATCVQPDLPPGTGTFIYDPPTGTLLPLNQKQPLRVTYTVAPENQWKYRPVSMTVLINVVPPRIPILHWDPPAAIPFGSKLTQFQLNARVSVDEGFLYYEPPRGTILASGETHTLKVSFIPNDHLEWAQVSLEVPIYIYMTDPVLMWEPARYFFAGMALAAEHLCCRVATSGVEIHGTMAYTPGLGAMLPPGEHMLRATFTCDKRHRREYNHVTMTVPFVVLAKKWPNIQWLPTEEIIYGTHLTKRQLRARADVPGRFDYSPPLGTVLDANPSQVLTCNFYPLNTVEYNETSLSISLCVRKATPKLTWEAPPFIYIGQAMLPKHLNATCPQPGTMIYCPELGEILPLGKHTMTVIFKPAAEVSMNFSFASSFSTLLVIEEGSLFKMPKRYLEPEVVRSFPVDDREFLLESDTLAWFSSEVDCQPQEPVRKVVEKMRAAMAQDKNKARYKMKDEEDRRREEEEKMKVANWVDYVADPEDFA